MEITIWKEIGEKIEKFRIREESIKYRIAPFTQWKVLIAEESTELETGRPAVIKIRNVRIPQNTIIGPLSIMRHANGTLIDVIEKGLSKVEDEKILTHAVMLPIEEGSVERGDIVGVLKVFFVKTGTISRRLGFSPSDIRIREEMVDANITYRFNGQIERQRIRTRFFGYFRSHIAEWEPVIADESIDVQAGEVTRVKIKEINLQPNTVVTPLHIMRNALGSVVDVVQLGKPSKVEDEKRIHQAIFVARRDGRIEKGDLIGILNVYYVALGNFIPKLQPKGETFADRVMERGEGLIRKGIRIRPFAYRRKAVARWEPIIADEDVKVGAGKVVEIDVKPISIEENTILYPLYIMRNAYGSIIDLIERKPSMVEERKEITRVLFMPVFDGEIKRDQLLGVVNVYSVEVRPYETLSRWLNEWAEEMKNIFARVG